MKTDENIGKLEKYATIFLYVNFSSLRYTISENFQKFTKKKIKENRENRNRKNGKSENRKVKTRKFSTLIQNIPSKIQRFKTCHIIDLIYIDTIQIIRKNPAE